MRKAVLPAPLGPPPSSGHTLMTDPGLPEASPGWTSKIAFASCESDTQRTPRATMGRHPQISAFLPPTCSKGGIIASASVHSATGSFAEGVCHSRCFRGRIGRTRKLGRRSTRSAHNPGITMSSAAATLDAFINRVGGISTPFSIELPDGEKRSVGKGRAEFHAGLRNARAMRALRTLDEGDIAEAYLQGDIDIEGDMLKPFALRASLDDRHPLVAAWRFIEPLLFGQVYTNKHAISSHYNADPKLFLSFLDPVFPAYSQGVYGHDDEPLSKALERKSDWAI